MKRNTSGWWALFPGAWPDSKEGYKFFKTRADFPEWLPGESVAHVYVGSREPWTEVDPYPDWQVFRGQSKGSRVAKWERA